MDIKKLAQESIAAKEFAYTPYSHFRVGAALLTKDGGIYRGCNIENAAYTPTNCDANDYLYPCGVCRQVMAEFCDPETFQVILVNTPDDFKIFTLEELLPGAFTKQDITKATGKEL